MKNVDAQKGMVTFEDEDGTDVTMSVTGGNVKMQWKPDFGMRWAKLGVDFEMFGKDHQANAGVYSKICKNGIAVEDWLYYAMPESLALYMFQKPRTAKRLFFDVIPKATDEYFQHLKAFPDVSAANASDADILWGFIERYEPGATPQAYPVLDKLVGYAVRYYEKFVKPHKTYRAPNDMERAALTDLATRLKGVKTDDATDADALQTLIFTVGKEHAFENLRDWFKAIYELS